jgi:hypothetical protein
MRSATIESCCRRVEFSFYRIPPLTYIEVMDQSKGSPVRWHYGGTGVPKFFALADRSPGRVTDMTNHQGEIMFAVFRYQGATPDGRTEPIIRPYYGAAQRERRRVGRPIWKDWRSGLTIGKDRRPERDEQEDRGGPISKLMRGAELCLGQPARAAASPIPEVFLATFQYRASRRCFWYFFKRVQMINPKTYHYCKGAACRLP